jgi:hypothetical protein
MQAEKSGEDIEPMGHCLQIWLYQQEEELHVH